MNNMECYGSKMRYLRILRDSIQSVITYISGSIVVVAH